MLVALTGAANGGPAPKPIDVGGRKQLFIDRKFIADDRGITLRMNPPIKLGPVLSGDRPWENGWISGYASVLESDGKYRMWYQCSDRDSDLDVTGIFLCYAESTDAVHWERPSLGLFEFQGSKANNILMRSHNGTAAVFLDPKAPPPERYKLLAKMTKARGTPGPEGDGMYLYSSEDGVRWKLHPTRLFPSYPDTFNQMFYDPRIDRYVAYYRLWDGPRRKVGRAEMKNVYDPWPYRGRQIPPHEMPEVISIFPRPSQVETAFSYDAIDPGNSDHYTPGAFQYAFADEAYFAFPSAYRHFPDPPESRFASDGPLDIQMAVSRDGRTYQRVEHAPYIGLGPYGGGDGGSMYAVIGCLRYANEIYQYYGGFSFTHGAYGRLGNRNIGAIFATKQRLDGFVSVDAPMTGGSFVTPPLVFQGNSLMLNMDASAMGEVKVELRDETGSPVPGRTFAEADPLGLNYLSVPVTWGRNSDVSTLNGKPIQIAFKLRAVKLYAFQFTAQKFSAPALWQAPYAPGQPAAAPTDPQELQRLLFMEHGRYVYELELKQKELDDAKARLKVLETSPATPPPRK